MIGVFEINGKTLRWPRRVYPNMEEITGRWRSGTGEGGEDGHPSGLVGCPDPLLLWRTPFRIPLTSCPPFSSFFFPVSTHRWKMEPRIYGRDDMDDARRIYLMVLQSVHIYVIGNVY